MRPGKAARAAQDDVSTDNGDDVSLEGESEDEEMPMPEKNRQASRGGRVSRGGGRGRVRTVPRTTRAEAVSDENDSDESLEAKALRKTKRRAAARQRGARPRVAPMDDFIVDSDEVNENE